MPCNTFFPIMDRSNITHRVKTLYTNKFFHRRRFYKIVFFVLLTMALENLRANVMNAFESRKSHFCNEPILLKSKDGFRLHNFIDSNMDHSSLVLTMSKKPKNSARA